MPNLTPPPTFIAKKSWWPTEAEQWIDLKSNPVAHKRLVETIRQATTDTFKHGTATSEVIIGYAITIDYLLWHAWFTHGLHKSNAALIAVGGYGRAELHLYSDIDLMILLGKDFEDEFKQKLTEFLTFLWDSGLDIGHSVRTVKEAVTESKKDITVITAIMEARALCGNISLFNDLKKATAPNKIWNSKRFYLAKKEELLARHEKYGDTFYQLEPNIKEGPGGLRDIQFIDWITKRHFNTRMFSDLIKHGFLQEEEYNQLRHSQEYLWKIRFSLQLITHRREERLLFDHQIELARASGYNNLNSNLAVEQFMQNFYRHIAECAHLVELLDENFEETCLPIRFKKREKVINSRFVTRGDVLYARNDKVFEDTPSALLELFLLMQQNKRLTKVSSNTIRLIHKNLHLIDDKFRKSTENRSLFIEILRQPKYIAREMKRMHRYGVLAAYWPAFARIVGRMQYDLYHVFTVDQHILTVLQEACRLSDITKTDKSTHAIFSQLPKPELLYLASLFHDVAKGRKGDHSSEGADEAIKFCLDHGLSQYDAELVGWLVQNHLEMSMTAQHKDTSDPAIIHAFADKVSNLIGLNYLYLLTIADIKGTNPTLWNNWRATLLLELYQATASQLRAGVPQDSSKLIQALQKSALAQLAKFGHSQTECELFWKELDNDYFLRHSDDEITWHTHTALEAKQSEHPQVRIRQLTSRGCTEIFIYDRDKRYLFANITDCLHNLGLNVLDARIITSSKGHALDTFIVLDQDNKPIENIKRCQQLEQYITNALLNSEINDDASTTYISRRLRHFHATPNVEIKNSPQTALTSLHIKSTDFPGLLARIAHVLAELEIKIHGARVSTLGEKVHDIFYVTTSDDKKITDSALQERLVEKITERISMPTPPTDQCINL